jgi:hypothetical protein
MLKNALWSYVSNRYDEDGVIPHGDEIYLKFQLEFDTGAPMEWIDETVYNFTRIHDLTDIAIQWEGELDERCFGENYQR